MQPYDENTNITKRLGVSLNIDTGYKKPIDTSMLDTPVARRPNGQRDFARETFLDDITPVGAGRETTRRTERDSRDSHDLSLSPRNITRDSLVDNMLLSFDQMSFSQGPPLTSEEAQLYSTFAEGSDSPSKSRHNQSYSSDYDNTDDGSRYSNQYARGRRSNSTSNFPTGGAMGRVLHSAGGAGTWPTQAPSRSHTQRKDSKGSSANSFDVGHVQVSGSHRWTAGHGRRSSSLDHGNDRSAFDARPNYSDQMPSSYEYEAAPTPTVPVGPRRTRPISPIGTELSSTASRGLERKRSNKSSKLPGRARPDTAATTSAQKYGLHERDRELPPLPAFNKNAPEAAIKEKDAPIQPQAPIAGPAPSRPGFFRRVFGGSTKNIAAADPAPSSPSVTIPVEPAERTSSKQQNDAPSQTRPPTPPSRQAMRPNTQPAILQKKPSSFFRRRKKSFSEPAPMPTAPVPASSIPPALAAGDFSLGVLPSPASSLRQVMNPYLDGPAKSPIVSHKRQESSRNLDETVVGDMQPQASRGFSSGYKPAKDATIRPVQSISPSRTRPSLDMQRSESGSHIGATDGQGATFLSDTSDVDYSSSPELKRNVTAQSKSPASDVAHDKTLVAEYERTHSKKSALESQVTDGDEVVMLAPTSKFAEVDRVRLETTASEENLSLADIEVPALKEKPAARLPSSAADSVDKSATSLPLVQMGDEDARSIHDDDLISPGEAMKMLETAPEDLKVIVVGVPTEGERQKAQKIYDGNEDFIQQSKAAGWLGGEGEVKARTLIAYMELYDFSNINILAGLRKLCGKLSLRAESQQVDRILDVFAQRWCACNPNHGFKVVGEFG